MTIEADLGRTFAAWSGQLDSFAADIRAVLAEYQRPAEPVFADLPPDPALELAPDKLEDEFNREDALNRMVRRKQAEDKWAQQGRVPEVPPEPQLPLLTRLARGFVGYLEQVKREKAMK